MGELKFNEIYESGTVLDFPSSDSNSTNSTTITPKFLYEFLASNEDNESIKIILENYFIERIEKMTKIPLENSPFDAIFISDLQADVLYKANYFKLIDKSQIKDLSNEISFEDGLDD